MVGAVIHPGLVPARLPDVAGVGSEYRDPSPTPHGAQRGARHLPAIVNVAQSAERPPCKGQVARSTRAVGSGLCGCEFIEPYNSAELSASAEHHGGTPIRPWRIGTARNEERAKRLVTAGRDRRSGPTGFDVEQRTHLTAPAGAHTAVITLGNDQSPTTTSPLFRLRPESVDTRGVRVAYRRHHTSWTGAIRRRPVETQTVVEAPTPRRQGPLRALRAATRVSEGVFWSFADPGSIPGGSTSQKQWAKGGVIRPATRGEIPMTKADFIRQHPDLHPKEVSRLAQEAGMTISANHVRVVRCVDKKRSANRRVATPDIDFDVADIIARAVAAAPDTLLLAEIERRMGA